MGEINRELLQAARLGNFQNLKNLIVRYGLHNSEAHGYVLLRESIIWGNTAIAELLLNSGAYTNSKMSKQIPSNSPLHFAIEDNNLRIVKKLIEHGAEIDAVNGDGFTPLHVAVKHGRDSIVELLLKHGASVNSFTQYKQTVLSLAVSYRPSDIIEVILKYNPDRNNESNKNSLIFAAKQSDKSYSTVVENLLEYGFCVGREYVNDTRLLHNAIKMGYIQIIQSLITHGLNLTCNKEENDIILHIAVKNKQFEAAKLLLRNGVDVNAIDEMGKPAIFYAINNSDVNMIKFLISHNSARSIWADAKNKEGDTALHWASRQSNPEIISIFLGYGCPINSKNANGDTALHSAIYAGQYDNIKLLLKLGSDINILNNLNYTPFGVAHQFVRSVQYYEHLILHLIMLKTADLYINERDLKILDELHYHRKILHKEECEDEIENLKLEKIANSKLSFHNLLTKNINSLARYSRNEDLIQILESDYYKTKFPIYAPIIERNLKKCTQRHLLLEIADEFFKFYSSLPYDCSEQILRYLSDVDLENIKSVWERPPLLKPACVFFKRHFELPYNCSNQVLSYLSNADLKNIINVSRITSPVEDCVVNFYIK